jgi:CheY-like chemotaxis protein
MKGFLPALPCTVFALSLPHNAILLRMSNKRILVIDDEPTLSTLLLHYLKQLGGYDVRVENLSSHALRSARSFLPDLILLDVNMPGKDGGEVASDLRADPAFSDTPILFLTSLVSSAEAGKREIKRGNRHFLAKPVNHEALLGAVSRMLAGSCSNAF